MVRPQNVLRLWAMSSRPPRVREYAEGEEAVVGAAARELRRIRRAELHPEAAA